MTDPSGNWSRWLTEVSRRFANSAEIGMKILISPLKAMNITVGAEIGFGAEIDVNIGQMPV